MTRKEEIENAAKEYTHNEGLKQIRGDWKSQEAINIQADNALFTNEDMINTFNAGARWADAHPIHYEDIDLEKELKAIDDAFFDLDGVAVKAATSYLTVEDVKDIAKYFFELGQKAMKKYIKGIPLNGWQTPCADPNYPCENPQMDCINCPRFGHPQGTITMTSMEE